MSEGALRRSFAVSLLLIPLSMSYVVRELVAALLLYALVIAPVCILVAGWLWAWENSVAVESAQVRQQEIINVVK